MAVFFIYFFNSSLNQKQGSYQVLRSQTLRLLITFLFLFYCFFINSFIFLKETLKLAAKKLGRPEEVLLY